MGDSAAIVLSILGIAVIVYLICLCISREKDRISEERLALQKKEKKEYHLEQAKWELQRQGFQESCIYSPRNMQWIFSIDKSRKKWAVSCYEAICGTYEQTDYSFSDLIAWSVSENGNTQISSNAGAALGAGILFGAVGAVAASAASRDVQETCSSLAIELTVNSSEKSRRTLKIIGIETSHDSEKYRSSMELVKNITAELAYIKANAGTETGKISNSAEQKEFEQPKADIYEEIEKLHGLKEKGIITEEEFNQKKKSLLGI